MIVIGDDLESLARLHGYVERAATFTCADCMPYENNQPIWITRGLRQAISRSGRGSSTTSDGSSRYFGVIGVILLP